MILELEIDQTVMIPIRKDQHRIVRTDETESRVTLIIEPISKPKPAEGGEGQT